jgi:gliding motility-associated-like protein
MNTIVLADNPVECIQIPDAFTPNGDNNNDTWIIENIEMFPNHVVQVFNRWGQVVYFKKYGDEPWDGTLQGKKLPTGSYVYVVDLHNQMEAKTGTVTIIY